MQVFKLYIKLFRSHIPSSIIYIVVFFAIAIPMSRVGLSQTSFEERSLKLCIFDDDQSEASKNLIDHLSKNNKMISLERDNQKILDASYYESVDYVFSINKGFEQKLSGSSADITNESFFSVYSMHQSYQVALMEQYLDEYVRTVRAYLAAGNDMSEALKKTDEVTEIDAEVTYENFAGDKGQVDYSRGSAAYFQYLPYVFICILVNTMAPILIAFNRRDERFRINASCFKQSRLTFQLFLGCAVIVGLVWLIFFVGGLFVGDNGFYQGVAWIAVLNSFIFALISAAITLLISSFSPSDSVISLIAQIISLGMSFLCGVFVPQSMLGDGVLAAARFLPGYWYVRANNSLAGISPYNIGEVWTCIGVEVGFLVLLALSYMLINYRGFRRAGAHS